MAKKLLERAVRGAAPGNFAMVMATGIVSAALRQAGSREPSEALLWLAAAAFGVLTLAAAARAAAFPAEVRGDLMRTDRVFSYFAFPAAASVLGSDSGQHQAAAALAVATALAWLAVTCAVISTGTAERWPVRHAAGSWELWVVGTQATAIAATTAAVPAGVAVAVWSAGVVLYALVTAMVVTRLLVAGLGPDDPFAPYWVTMGAASITVLAATQVLPGPRGGPVLTDMALIFWSVATGLIPVLIVAGAARRLRRPGKPRFRRELWMISFPCGMYALASMRLGDAAGRPLIHDIGAALAWPAAAVWALVFAGMVTALPRSLRR
ncbi:MAG: hypothetical protein JO132_15290 [Streptosporangiaceae bacterium]|nr:hypothetical protein [Streptosporangiaceae bacterium]